MRVITHSLLFALLFSTPALGAGDVTIGPPTPVTLEFSGYRFGQSPAANMVCFSGYCKSQAPGGDGRFIFPYSTYDTPGAVSTLSGLMVVNTRYAFWEDRLYRIFFQVDCSDLENQKCVDDIIKALDREYDLTPLSSSEVRQFVLNRHVITMEFMTESGAFIKVRADSLAEGSQMSMVDIMDKREANLVGAGMNPSFKPKAIPLPADLRKK